ncbi:sulfotransferase family cytosolic 1B member 1-like [Cimex lectularius]|uniref:Sulfotransferase domain-containing protein n=1 Tax=Cimex lectularius TaxID=79782 RepID=A0A8I6TCS6_CIMLE|nr:sulfotransferase family cytosolic 1B member 1-like [Cimex lectularius]
MFNCPWGGGSGDHFLHFLLLFGVGRKLKLSPNSSQFQPKLQRKGIKMSIKYQELTGEDREKLDSLYGVPNCLIKVNPGGVLLPPKYKELGERIHNMEVHEDDVWLVSYPRTGSTWAQEMVWCICNNLDFETARSAVGQQRNPLLELTALLGNDKGSWKEAIGNSVEQVENTKSPRFIKTHLPRSLLPKQLFTVKPKIIYVTRNAKDMCVSYFHYTNLLHDYHGSFDEFCDLFLAGKAPIGPYWDHVLAFWEMRDEPNVLFLKYEEMKKDHKAVIRKTANFLEKPLTEEQVVELEEHLSFKKMRENPAINLDPFLQARNGPGFRQEGDKTFIRKGQVGDWRNYMSEELSNRFDKWTKENLEGTGLEFQAV